MFNLPFWMVFHKENINLEKIPQIPDFENEISKKYTTEYLELFREFVNSHNEKNQEQMKLLQPKISKLTSKLEKSAGKFGGNDMRKFVDMITKLSNI